MGSEDLRVGDAEREAAIQALGEHFSAGRLTVDEYGERSARVTTAKTAGEVHEQFADLPAPHPALTGQPAPPAPPQPAAPVRQSAWDAVRDREDKAEVERHEERPPVQRAARALVALSGVLGIVLLFTAHTWLFLLLPMVLSMVFGTIWGKGWGGDDHGRQRNRDRRDRRNRYYY